MKLKKKSHFLLESQTIEEIIGKFKGYVGNLRPVQKLMLGKEILNHEIWRLGGFTKFGMKVA